jgi:leader peptidase (prepilin peptidase)/N-methyltransferase
MTGREGMGGGDIKLLAMIGAWMGWQALPLIVLIASLTGAVIGVVFILFSGKGYRFRIPFGPFLSLGAMVYLFFGRDLTLWYFGLFV